MKISKEVTCKYRANCAEILEYRNFKKVLYKIKCELESQIKKRRVEKYCTRNKQIS
jgi:hypothetical protein